MRSLLFPLDVSIAEGNSFLCILGYPHFAEAASLILVVNVAFFLAAPPYLFGARRVVATTPSWPTIRARDQYLAERVAYIRQHFDPASTVILTTGPDYRHPDYYLRGYTTLNQSPESLVGEVPAGNQDLVIFGDSLTSRQKIQIAVLPSGAPPFYLPLNTSSESEITILQ